MKQTQSTQATQVYTHLGLNKNHGFNLKRETTRFDLQRTFQRDLARSFDMPPADANDMIIFLTYHKYLNPFSPVVFTIDDYCKFFGRTRDSLKRMPKGFKRRDDATNYIDHILREFRHKKLVYDVYWRTDLESPGSKSTQVQNESADIVKSYQKMRYDQIQNHHVRDQAGGNKKVDYYLVEVSNEHLSEMCYFTFTINMLDYHQLAGKYYRNANMRIYYQFLCNLRNELVIKKGKISQPNFDELATLLGYTEFNNVREVKRKIYKYTNQLLMMEGLQEVSFEWKPTMNNQMYKPYFYIKEEIKKITLETEAQKYKRLDIAFVYHLRVSLKRERLVEEESIKSDLVISCLERAYHFIFDRNPTQHEIQHFKSYAHYLAPNASYQSAMAAVADQIASPVTGKKVINLTPSDDEKSQLALFGNPEIISTSVSA